MAVHENKAFKALHRVSDVTNTLVNYSCIVAIGGMTFVVLLGVLFRYVFRSPLGWSEELSRYLMIWGASLAISIGIKENGHVGLTIIMDSSKSKALRIFIGSLIFIFSIGFVLIMLYYGVFMAKNALLQISMGLGMSMFLPSLAIPVSMGLALIQLVIKYAIDVSEGFISDDNEKKIIDI